MSNLPLPPEEERFAKTIIVLGQAVYECVRQLHAAGNKDLPLTLVGVVISTLQGINSSVLIQTYIENSYRYWEQIRVRDELFCIEHAGEIFKALPIAKVNLFKDIFVAKYKEGPNEGEYIISKNMRNQIWDLLHAMTKISQKYVHKGRQPYSARDAEGNVTQYYSADYFEEIDLQAHAAAWNVVLEFPLNI